MKTNSPQSDRQGQREQLTADIIGRVALAIQEECTAAPRPFSASEFEEIERPILDHTRQVLEALSFNELQSEGALLTHIANARWEVGGLIRELLFATRKSIGQVKHK
jgi:hypothetical protein